jgi:TonB-dependent receptor
MRKESSRLIWLASASGLAMVLAAPAAAQTADQAAPISTPAEGSAEDAAARQSSATTTTQEGDPAASEADVIVTGVRASLQGAQSIKRNSTQVVDSIVAEDIGKLPDNTVSDALQRVTGIQVYRGGGEVNAVLVRGLPNVQSLINGREAFTGVGRGVALQDIPAELVAGVDVYKTTTPDQIEGSVSGTIDIRLRRPFDFTGFEIAGGARAFYSDKRDKWSYVTSGLVSNRWEMGDGAEFGVLIGASYNDRKYQDQTAFNFGFNPLSATDPTLIPDTVGGLVTDGNRQRPSVNVSLQFKPTPDLEFYADGLYTGYRQDYDVNFFVGLPKAGAVTVNTRQTGTALLNGVERPVAGTITTRDNFTITSKQAFAQKTDGYQANFGTRYTAGRALLSAEFTYNKSKVRSRALIVDTAYVVPRIDYDFNAGGTPSINFNGFDVTNGANLNLLTLFDNRDASNSEQYAGKADLLYTFDNGFLRNFKVGARYARRTGDSGSAQSGALGLNFLSQSGFPGLIANAPDEIIDGRLGVNNFALASTSFINDNADRLRALAGRPAGDPAFDPNRTFSLRETVYAAYGQVSFGTDNGALEGTAGVRAVNTVTALNAVQLTTIPPGPPVATPIEGRRNELNLLPSVTLKIRPVQDVILRLVAGKQIFRPQFTDLNPAIGVTLTGITGGSSSIGTGNGGNANLRSVKSDNFDATAEWYFSNTGSLTVAGFYKKLDNYIQTDTLPESVPGFAGDILVTRPQNSATGKLKGVEIAGTQFLDFLPGALGGFGAQASFTYASGSLTVGGIKRAITPLSKYSYNLVGIYEKYGFSARLAYNWRSSYTDSFSSVVPGGLIRANALSFLDFSASYAVTDNITLTVDATNLLDEKYQDNFGPTGLTPRDTRVFDRTFGAGARFRF